MSRSVCSCLCWLGMILRAPAPVAAAPDHPIVAGFERFYSGAGANQASGGRLLLTELNCVSCHVTADVSLARKQAPILDHVGSRLRISYLRKYLADPQSAKPGTTMPHLLAGVADAREKVEALVHFLAATGTLRQERPVPKYVAAGRDLYHKVGCFACHGTRNAAGEQDQVQPTSVPLGDLKAKYAVASLAGFLENPHSIRPGGRMPKLLNALEARAVASYLLAGATNGLLAGQGTANYSYYEGSWEKLPDFASIKPKATGTTTGFDLAIARRESDFAIKFDAFLKIDTEATYSFSLMSDDGSRLSIDGKTVIDNDGVHAPTTRRGRAKLSKGIHKVTIAFFQVGGGAELEVSIGAAGLVRSSLGDLVANSEAAFEKKSSPKKDDPDAITIEPALVAKGRGLFGSLGCANCHTLHDDGKVIASTASAPALANLHGEAGCLSAAPAKGVPVYALNARQRAAITAALKTPAAPKSKAETVAATLTRFNCYACHTRDKVGGPEEAINKFFTTTQQEMGDEGRVPPPLDGVGAKLNAPYFKNILDQGAHDRPYMHTRMPGFGLANVGQLVEVLAGLDRLPVAPKVVFADTEKKVKATGRHLAGSQAFGCIKCHTFAGQKAEGVQGIDMLLMPKRVRHDWFHAYLDDPQRIRPGTRMPAAFIDGKSVLWNIYNGAAPQQIEALWIYLLDGGKAQIPVGVGTSFIPLEPGTSAIIYRNFIAGAGTRAIAVGYPEKASIAFDANEMRLALLWQGAFLDAARHWTDRGSGFASPRGDNILTLHHGAPFAVLDKLDDAWPGGVSKTLGYRFLGYKLTSDDRPTFLYSFAGVKIADFPTPVTIGKEVALRRTISFVAEKPPDNFIFRAAAGNKIVDLKDGWYRIDDTWKFKVPAGVKAHIHARAGKSELRVPVQFAGGKAQLVFEYSW